MPKVLGREQVAFYEENGYLAPFTAMPPDETSAMRASLDAFERDNGYSAGDMLTFARNAFMGSFAAPAAVAGFEMSKYPTVANRGWYCQTLLASSDFRMLD